MTPSQPAPWGLNIDQMLQNLSTVPQDSTVVSQTISTPEVAVPSPVLNDTSLWTNFSIENIAKPVSPVVPQMSEQIVSKSFFASRALRITASILSTLLLIVIWWFVLSKQYPIETEQFTNQLFGVVDAVVDTTQKNIQPDTIIVENSIGTWDDTQTHSSAPDNYITDTPLADAIAQSQDALTQDTSTDEVLTTVVGDSATASWVSDLIVTPESTPSDMQLPSVDTPLTKSQLQQKLLTLSQSAEQAMTNLIGNSDIKMAKMRAVYKTSQSLIAQISDESFVPDGAFTDQINQLQSLYDSTVVQ